VDCDEHITNIFWADAKMTLDYAYFGDVVTFDTTFGTNKEYRPFGVFLGLDHFRETTIFGAAILFDETEDSFTWLFETFLATHNGKQPKTIYTDQDAAMEKAIKNVFTESYHGKKKRVRVTRKMKNLIFSLILELVCMTMRTRRHLKKHLTL
jgi:zinc finger SWIM domain-containing protein 3